MEIQQPNLGKKIAKLRKAKGLTQEELVEKCNISVRTLQRIEAGEVAPRSYTVKLIFAALGEDVYGASPSWHEGVDFHKVYSYVLDLFNLKTNAMKKLTILSIFFLTICTVIFTACLSNKKALSDEKSLIGTWQITRNGIVDTTYNGQNGLIRYKVITANRFVVTDIMYKQKIMYAAMEGSYTVDQGHKTYSELVENAGNGYTQYMNGKIGTYNYKIVDSLWYIKGNGYDEVWKKVK
jgi:transcriptional regulator with XRE-family HTH domain